MKIWEAVDMGGGSSVKIWEAVDMGGGPNMKISEKVVDMGGGSNMKNLGGGGYGRRFLHENKGKFLA